MTETRPEPHGQKPAAVELCNLSKDYGDFAAVRDLTLTISLGEVFGLLGPNGAGKTTTMKMLIGVLCATRGHARIAGYDCFEQRAEVMRHVGYLPDEPVFYDYLRGSEIIRFVGEMRGVVPRSVQERAAFLVTQLELSSAIDDYAVNYSRGMKKKLGLVLALIHDPDVLILDEPTNGLDPHATRQIHESIRDLRARNKTVVLSTHLLEQAQKVCTRIGILHQGRLVTCGTLADLATGGRSLEDLFFEATGGTGTRLAETP
jgi:ABC-2 type transport system ATP-binding protein